MKNFLETSFPLDGQKTNTGKSLWKIQKKLVSTNQKIGSTNQKTLSPLGRKSVSTSRMKNLLKNSSSLYRKVTSTLKNLKISENVEKLVFTSWNILLL